MNRLLISLAVLAIGAQAFAGGTPIVRTPQQAVQQGPTSLASQQPVRQGPTSLVPQITSAQFVPKEAYPGDSVFVGLGGINLGPHGVCWVKPIYPAGYPSEDGNYTEAAWNGNWNADYSLAPSVPGTYVVTYQAVSDPTHGQCLGVVTATLVVKSRQPGVNSVPTPIAKPTYNPVDPGNPGTVR